MNNTAPIDRLTELEKWHTHMEAIESATDRLYKLLGSAPESEFMTAIGDMQMHYTALMSRYCKSPPTGWSSGG